MSYTRFGGVYACATQVFLADIFTCYGLYNFRTGEEHIGSAFHHQRKVGKGGRVNGTAGARTEDTGNLRNNAGSKNIALENLGITRQSVDTFLNTGTA